MLRESLAISLERGLMSRRPASIPTCRNVWSRRATSQAAADLLEEGIAFDTAHDLDAWTFYLIGRKAHLFFGRWTAMAMPCRSRMRC